MGTVYLEKYRQRYESDEHWLLRRSFIERHYGSMSNNRLLCLAQVYANMEILGCRYPAEIMRTVRELAEGLQRLEKSNLFEQVCFVKAREDVGSKVSEEASPVTERKVGRKRPGGELPGEVRSKRAPSTQVSKQLALLTKFNAMGQLVKEGTVCGANVVEKLYLAAQKVHLVVTCDVKRVDDKFSCNLSLDSIHVAEGTGSKKKAAKTSAVNSALQLLMEPSYVIRTINGEMKLCPGTTDDESTSDSEPEGTKTTQDHLENIRIHFPNFVIVENSWETSALNTLNMSAALNKVKCMMKSGDGTSRVGFCYMNNVEIGKGFGENSKVAKNEAAKEALSLLRKLRPTVRIKPLNNSSGLTKQMVTEEVDSVPRHKTSARDDNEACDDKMGRTGDSSKNNEIADDNIGFKLLKLMGWSGGGMGKDSSGIVEPILPKETVGRAGLGFEGKPKKSRATIDSLFKRKINKMLSDFAAKTLLLKDLVFSAEFDSEERKYIHGVSKRLGLKSVSRNGPEGRFLSVRHKITPQALLERLLQMGSTEKYEVIEASAV